MKGLNHEFHLVLRDQIDPVISRSVGVSDVVRLHDDLIGYLWDTLNWIPTLNPSRSERGWGLNRWGQTVIDIAGAASSRRIFEDWADLFSASPPELELTGDWCWIEGELSESGKYESLRFVRDEVVVALRELSRYAAVVEKAVEEYVVLHLGI